jgi:hypothetical protein
MTWLASLLLVSLLVWGSIAQKPIRKPECSDTEAQRAESEAVMLRSWDDLFGSYKRYKHCDDAAIAEGYSEAVARILVDHCNTLSRLAEITIKDPDFRRFVLKRIDETLNLEDVKNIRANAEKRCPSGLRDLCRDIRKQAE